MARFITIFILVLFGLFTIEMLNPVQTHVIIPFTEMLARISAGIIMPFDDSVVAHGKILQFGEDGFAVSIEAGCNGIEATIVLIAAVLAFPAGWRQRLTAIGLGFLAIQAMNILRIISLFYLGRWNFDLFSWVHLYLWPTLIMLDVLIVFVVYLRYLPGTTLQAEPAGG
ncbi:MAG: exosortase H [Halioglobus sp.]|jgi:exosortase H (IPTLxxWG-CTERM-specific)